MVKDSSENSRTKRLSAAQQRMLGTYADSLLAENARAGLMSSGTGRAAVYERHFEESLALLDALESRALLTSPLIDIGSGAGFPGLILKIARPELAVTLLEAHGKKAAFLQAMAADLALDGVTILHQRAEDAGRSPELREAYPLAIARAVAPLRVLLELALPLVEIGGVLAAPKGSAALRELLEAAGALTGLSAIIESADPLPMPPISERVPMLIIIRKTAATPERYPRRPGIPAKRPL